MKERLSLISERTPMTVYNAASVRKTVSWGDANNASSNKVARDNE